MANKGETGDGKGEARGGAEQQLIKELAKMVLDANLALYRCVQKLRHHFFLLLHVGNLHIQIEPVRPQVNSVRDSFEKTT